MIYQKSSRNWARVAAILLSLILGAGGCAMMNIGESLSSAIMNQDDPGVVRDGAPAYLMLIDSFIESDPEDESMLSAGGKLYALYAGVFVDSPERAAKLGAKARRYGQRALCCASKAGCGLADLPFEEYCAALETFGSGDVPALFTFAVTWLVWAKSTDSGWSAMAALPKIEAALQRVAKLDETYENGAPLLYLGILNSLRPPALGGAPEKGREYFEQALAITDGKNLGVKVAYAQYYARLLYDRELHDTLLNEVMEASATAPGLTLTNTLAQEEAKELLESANDYF